MPYTEPAPEVIDSSLPECEQSGVTKTRSHTTTAADINHIDQTLHSRPRPLAKRNTGSSCDCDWLSEFVDKATDWLI